MRLLNACKRFQGTPKNPNKSKQIANQWLRTVLHSSPGGSVARAVCQKLQRLELALELRAIYKPQRPREAGSGKRRSWKLFNYVFPSASSLRSAISIINF